MTFLITLTAYFEWFVLALLCFLSIWSVKIMLERRRMFRAHTDLAKPILGQLNSKSTALTIDRQFRSELALQRLTLEKDLPILATLGANAPFVGLFGTVLGIIRAFAALGESSGGATSVMSGISQALYATAAGLFVAIPAVVAYNFYSNLLRARVVEAEAAKDAFVARQAVVT